MSLGKWPAVGKLTAMRLAGGVPGVGKTQLGMQLALDVQIPTELGGVEAAALYIDTEGSLMPTRMEQMALALQRHIAGVVKVWQEVHRGHPLLWRRRSSSSSRLPLSEALR